jgi:hypothetical protein
MRLVFSSLSGFSGGASRRVRYSLFKAADEKVPLSVVRVNNKPQYLVFCSHSLNLPSKHGDLPVESSKYSCTERVSALYLPLI